MIDLGREYKAAVAGRYRLITEKDFDRIRGDRLLTSVKLGGHLYHLYVDADEQFLFNRTGRVVLGLPVLEQAAALVEHGPLVLADELYSATQDRSRVGEVTHALGRGGAELAANLRFAAFDVLIKNGEGFQANSCEQADEVLAGLLGLDGPLHRVERHMLDRNGLRETFRREVIQGGQEGLICMSDDGVVYKVKNRQEIDAVIIGFTEAQPDSERGLEAGMVGSLLTALMWPDGTLQLLTRVSAGLTNALRCDLFHLLSDAGTESLFKATDENHTLFQMVHPEIIVEVSFLDIITETPTGKPTKRPVLSFEAEAYFPQFPERFVEVVFPTFSRLRDDKQVNPCDLRLTQLAKFVDLDNLERGSRALALSKSEILRREVYVKSAKEQTMVRKFISWRSNKQELDDSFPAYVFCFVDYSPNRKSPLSRTLRCATSEEAIHAIHDRFLAAQIKKGWAPI